MRFDYALQAALTGAMASALVITIPQVTTALPATEINKSAQQSTVLIEEGQGFGSGVIVAKIGNTYYVLTAKHVVDKKDQYTVQTPDGDRYPLDYSTVKKLPDVDLAVVQFTSDKTYNVAKLANSDSTADIGENIYIAGFSNLEGNFTQRLYQFTNGQITAQNSSDRSNGYTMVYANVTKAGMSGGPILNDDGDLIGIHGQKDGSQIWIDAVIRIPNGFNLGIPIQTFVSLAPQVGITWQIGTDTSPPGAESTIPNPPVNGGDTGITSIDVDQSKFIAVASPYGGHRYQLYILEQIPDKRACWSESGTNPTIVNMLLGDFDFTGICGRSTDSNGYSIRLAGQDLAWRRDLNIVRRGSELVLVGTSTTDTDAPPLEIGRSYGISSQGFIKIFLNPGWRFAKRMYRNQVVGHVYLINDNPNPNVGSAR